MKRFALTAIAGAAVLALSACGPTTVPHTATSEPAPSTEDVPADEETVAAPAQVEPSELGFTTEIFAFGETVTYDDGLSITIGKPEVSELSEFGSAGSCLVGEAITAFDVKIVNGTDKMWDPMMVGGVVGINTAEDGNGEYAEDVFDTLEDGTDTDTIAWVGELRPGMKAEYTQAFCATDLLLITDLSEDMDGARGELVFAEEGNGGELMEMQMFIANLIEYYKTLDSKSDHARAIHEATRAMIEHVLEEGRV